MIGLDSLEPLLTEAKQDLERGNRASAEEKAYDVVRLAREYRSAFNGLNGALWGGCIGMVVFAPLFWLFAIVGGCVSKFVIGPIAYDQCRTIEQKAQAVLTKSRG